ncbi:hypothetical protein ACRFOP_21545 [Klebsiella pneumoniae]
MHGNVNEICARLLDSFDPQQRISLLIWTAEDVHDCTSDMNLTDDEAEAVMASEKIPSGAWQSRCAKMPPAIEK